MLSLFFESHIMDCVLRSFAHAAELIPQDLMSYLEHDGSEIVDPSLEHPFNKRGFSTYEVIRALFDFGFSVSSWPKYEYRFSATMSAPKQIGTDDLILPYLTYGTYCLSNKVHMIGVNGQDVLDLTKKITDPRKFDYEMIYLVSNRYFCQ